MTGSLLLALTLMGQTCKNRGRVEELPSQLPFESYDYSGFRFVQDTVEKDVMSIRVMFLEDPASSSAEEKGISHLALQWVLQGGTGDNPNEFISQLRGAGASIQAQTHSGWTAITLSCPKEFFHDSWQLFSALLKSPAFPPGGFEKIRSAALAQLKKQNETLTAKAEKAERELFFPGSWMDAEPFGNLYSLEHLSAGKVKNWYTDSMLVKERMVFIVSGFADQEKLVNEILKSLDNLPAGKPIASTPAGSLDLPKNAIALHHIPGRTPLLRGYIPAPAASHPDAAAMQLALRILHRNISNTISKRYLHSKPPYMAYASGKEGYALLWAETNWPSDWAGIILKEINQLKRDGVDPKLFEQERKLFLTDLALDFETSGDRCEKIALAIGNGEWNSPLLLPYRLKNLTPKILGSIFNEYCGTVGWSCTGDTTGLNRHSFFPDHP